MRFVGACVLVAAVASSAAAERPRDVMIRVPRNPNTEAVSSNVIFMNRCSGGCAVTGPASDDSRIDRSSIAHSGTLTAFKFGDDAWQSVMRCMKDTFDPFNVVITDVDPGSASHLEIMVAGSPTQIGFGSQTGGVAPFPCQSYVSNVLVFDFANTWSPSNVCDGECIENICSTAAQEIAHSWALDHVTVAADPLTYFPYSGRRYYQNSNAQCGSDCLYSCSGQPCDSFGRICSGPSNQNKACTCTNQQTQNSFATIKGLFGAGAGSPPAVTISNPKYGASVQPGFNVTATATDDGSITKVELRVDNNLVPPALMTIPYAFSAPADLQPGSHHVEVTAYDAHMTPGKMAIDVTIGPPCEKPADCPLETDTCIGGRCVPGPGVQGGLGTPCTDGTMCAEGQCASDGTDMYCVSACMKGECPDGFGCLPTGDDPNVGACWPNYDDGSGGFCSVGSIGAGGPISLTLVFAALMFARRKRTAHAPTVHR